MPGFDNSADYFARRAERSREPAERSRLQEAAEHYRSLAKIVPELPKGYKANGVPPLISRIKRWEARAEECRTLADHFSEPQSRIQLLELAKTYERLASTHREG